MRLAGAATKYRADVTSHDIIGTQKRQINENTSNK